MNALTFRDHYLWVGGLWGAGRRWKLGATKKYASLGDQTLFRHLDQIHFTSGLPHSSGGKESVCNAEDIGDSDSITGLWRSPGEEMAAHSSILAWKIPWTEEPGGLQFMGLRRVRHDWTPTWSSFFKEVGKVLQRYFSISGQMQALI